MPHSLATAIALSVQMAFTVARQGHRTAQHVQRALHVKMVLSHHNHVQLALMPGAPATAIALSVQLVIVVAQEHRSVQHARLDKLY
jgi:uncharacterized protein GlcG (DUF336 family)